MAFVVPAEIGHAPYSAPLIEYLTEHFGHLQIVAIRKKLFPDLSEDCWLLYADDKGGSTNHIALSVLERFFFPRSPPTSTYTCGYGLMADPLEQTSPALPDARNGP